MSAAEVDWKRVKHLRDVVIARQDDVDDDAARVQKDKQQLRVAQESLRTANERLNKALWPETDEEGETKP